MKPYYEHDCTACVHLGSMKLELPDGTTRCTDLYRCNVLRLTQECVSERGHKYDRIWDHTSLLVRFSSEPSDYMAGDVNHNLGRPEMGACIRLYLEEQGIRALGDNFWELSDGTKLYRR
jgi:hypothetical protein